MTKKWIEKQGRYEHWQVEDVGNGFAIYKKDVNQEWKDSKGDNLLFETEGEARLYLRKVFEKEPTEKEVFEALDRAGIPFDLIRIEDGLREISICVEEVEEEGHPEIGDKLLRDATNKEIKLFASTFSHGYELSDEDCEEIRRPVWELHDPDNETVREAVDDFIRAYEC